VVSRAIVPLRFSARALFAVQSREAGERTSGSVLRNAGFAALVAVAYYAGTRLGFVLTPPGYAISVFWPPNAILLAALLLAPERLWWALLLAVLPAHLLAHLPNGIPISTALGWFLSNTTEALIGIVCISRFARRKSLFETVQGLLVFLIFGVLLAPLLTSLMDAAVVVTTRSGDGYWRLAATRLFSNMLAQLTLVPMIVIFVQSGRDRLWKAGWKRQLEAFSLAAGIVLVGVLVFGAEHVSLGNIPALVYVPLPLFLWASLRFGLGGLSTSLLGIALISTWNGMHGRGPFNSPSMMENVLSLKVLLCMVAVPLMLLAAVIADRRRTEQSLRDTSGKLIDAQEQERHHIARELHDDIGQRLTLVELGLENAQDDCDSSLKPRLSELHNQVREISRAAHEMSHGLHPSHLEHLGVVPAIRRLCQDVGREKSVDIHFIAEGLPERLPAPIALCLYRVTQEALQNIVRHSTARRGMVSMSAADGLLLLSIVDDGVGFELARQTASGLGLTSMRERLRYIGGTLLIASERMKGTRLDVSVPLSAQAPAISTAVEVRKQIPTGT
jgi:signal transduction histidine kinase